MLLLLLSKNEGDHDSKMPPQAGVRTAYELGRRTRVCKKCLCLVWMGSESASMGRRS